MRRGEREVKDSQKISDIIMSCDCCRLGLADGKSAYIVPLNFGFAQVGEKKTFYFHGAVDGRKIELIKQNAYAGFELDTGHRINEAEKPCNYSFNYRSVIGEGIVSFIEDSDEKKAALRLIMSHYSDKSDWEFSGDMLNSVTVFKLEVSEISCKERQ